jgi:hypothetical protein
MGQDNRLRPAKRGARRVLMAVVAATPLLGSAPAAAQWFDDDQPMPPRAAVRIAARHGFTDFSPPRLAGDVYIFNALADDGARVRLVIDAYSGRILRPLGVSADLAPPRPTRRLRPWDYAPVPDEEDELERQPVERFRGPRLGREDLVPPRPIGRERPSDLPLSRDAEIDLDRRLDESVRGPGPQREQRPAPAVRGEPNRKAARIEQPAREPAGPAPTERPRGADRPAPTSPAPVVETPAPPVQAKPETTAAVPPPTVPKSEPTAPAAAPRPEAVAPQKQAKPQAPAAAAPPAATASTSPPKVRVIEGVTPVVPQNTAPAEPGSSSEPSTIAQ